MKYLQLILFALLTTATLSAQNVGDAVRYSNIDPIGTARTVGVGGSFGAVGGDFSVIGINPAGMAEYRLSEFMFTPSITNAKTNSFFVADKTSSTKRNQSSFSLDNIGFVGANNIMGSGWQTSNWGVGFNKIATFNRNVTLAGETLGSISERFIERANGLGLDDLDGFEAGPAYDAGVIFQDASGNYISDFREDDIVKKDQAIRQRGGINELSVTWAGNYKNKLNLGFSVGVPFVSFDETKNYEEGLVDGDFSNQLQYIENLNTTGVGINFKMGMQLKPVRQLRLGASIHSPTWYSLNDDYTTLIDYQFATNNETFNGDAQSPDGSFKYGLSTPWKVIGSVGSIYKLGPLKGFINADLEFLDYTNNEFDFTRHSDDPEEAVYTQEVNTTIDNQLGSATNLRLGTEIAYDVFRFRAGYTISTSPYISETKRNNSWSAGLGYRADKFFIDMAYKRSNVNQGYNPYVVLDQDDRDPLANIETEKGRIVATIGFKF